MTVTCVGCGQNGIYGAEEAGAAADAFVGLGPKPTIDYPFVFANVKGDSGNHFAVKAGNAQNGTLRTIYDGARPSKSYTPMKKQGEARAAYA